MRDLLPGMVRISDLGVDIAKVRTSAGLSKDKMAIMCGVSGLTYNRWESGATQTIKEENFEKLRQVIEECKRRSANA